jgi:hypothetical protein
MTVPRPRAEIVEEICLGWLKDSATTRRGVSERIRLIERLWQEGFPNTRTIRERAKRAQRALKILGDDFSPTVAPFFALEHVVNILAWRVVNRSGGTVSREQAVEWLMDDQDGQIHVLPFTEILRRETYLLKAYGPDRRFDYLQWLCAHGAVVLLKEFSDRKPVSTKNGNVHCIGQLIRKAITGDEESKASGLRAAKAVMAWMRQ